MLKLPSGVYVDPDAVSALWAVGTELMVSSGSAQLSAMSCPADSTSDQIEAYAEELVNRIKEKSHGN